MRIKRPTAIVAGMIGAVLMTATLSLARGVGVTTLDLPMLLGALLTHEVSSLTWLLGLGMHLGIGAVIALGYAVFFECVGAAGPTRGMAVAISHTLIAGVMLAVLPWINRDIPQLMAAPGFMGAASGWFTPFLFVGVHLLYGSIVGGVYRASPVPVRHYARLKPRGLRPAHG